MLRVPWLLGVQSWGFESGAQHQLRLQHCMKLIMKIAAIAITTDFLSPNRLEEPVVGWYLLQALLIQDNSGQAEQGVPAM